MKFYVLVSVLIISYFSYQKFKPNKKNILPKHSAYLSCDGTSTDDQVTLKGEIFFVKSALPENEEERNKLFMESIVYQQMYTFTNLGKMHNYFIKSSNLGNRPQVDVLSTEEVEYPFLARFEPNQEIYFFGQNQQDYLRKILSLGKIEKGEPALKVTYNYFNNLNLCLQTEDLSLLKKIDYLTPKDPYFAYFAVAPEDRIMMTCGPMKTKGIANPCMDSSAIAGNSVAPFALWYHWLPKAKGSDENKKSFDCEKLYNSEVILKSEVEFIENPVRNTKYFNFKEFDSLKRPIKVSAHYGAYDSLNFQPFIEKEVLEYVKKYTSNISTAEAKRLLPSTNNKYDYNFSSMLITIWSLRKHIAIHSIDSKINPYDLIITLRGKLNLSKKDIQFNFSVSKNKPGSEGAGAFNQAFSDSVIEDDIVIYNGHASYGGVLHEALRMARSKESKIPVKDLKYQLIALYSCNSNFYFPSNAFPKSAPQRDFISTGGGYSDYTGKATLGLIASIDSYLYNESYVPFGLWSKQFKTDNFLILSND